MDIYNYHPTTQEFINQSKADISPLEPDVYLIPAFATEIQPPSVAENEAAVFDDNSKTWNIVPDYRNVTLWHKLTAQKVTAALGQTPDDINATQIQPTVDYPKWDATSEVWITDETVKLSTLTSAAASEIQRLQYVAADKIAPLQDAVDLGIATTEETVSLAAWKIYRVAVNRVPTQSSYPLTIDWPEQPL